MWTFFEHNWFKISAIQAETLLTVVFNGPAGVVAQLADQLLPTPEVCSLKPVIGKILYRT